ncbi:MAG: hypothetical protein MJZ20_06990 [Bacteroidaceae bacterium]|nr:hypothetical protein [Bacteroidaceae bacterium]
MWKLESISSELKRDCMFVHKKSDGGVTFVGYNIDKHIYTTDYYANVGICNAAEPKIVSGKMIRGIIKRCKELGYSEVSYLSKLFKI